MKNFFWVTLVLLFGLVACDNSSQEATSTEDDATVQIDETAVEASAEVEMPATADSMITPADMPEQAKNEMYSAITAYNECMMQNRLEYHQQGAQVAQVADKTLQACEPHLDEMKVILDANEVNAGLREKMANTMRSRAVRKLMSAVMQSMAGQAAALANAQPEASTETVAE